MKINKLFHLLAAALIMIITTTCAISATSQKNASNNSLFNEQQTQAIQTIIHDYLVNNPEVLIEASRALQQKQMQVVQKQAIDAIKQNYQLLFNDANSPVIGNKNGKVVLVEFFDYQCGHCKAMNRIIQSIVKKNPNIKVIFKEFPIFGQNSQLAAKAALAAKQQGKYFEFHDALLSAPDPITPKQIFAIAKKLGINVQKLKKAMESSKIKQQLVNNYKLAKLLKLVGTPAFIVAYVDSSAPGDAQGVSKTAVFRYIPGAVSEKMLQQNIDAVSKNENQ